MNKVTTLFDYRSVSRLILLSLCLILPGCGVVSLQYPNLVENDPLFNPVKVTSCDSETIVLDDGRTLKIAPANERVENAIEYSGHLVDLEPLGHETYAIHVKSKNLICGTAWAGLIHLPIFPLDIPVYERRRIAEVQLTNTKPSHTQSKSNK